MIAPLPAWRGARATWAGAASSSSSPIRTPRRSPSTPSRIRSAPLASWTSRVRPPTDVDRRLRSRAPGGLSRADWPCGQRARRMSSAARVKRAIRGHPQPTSPPTPHPTGPGSASRGAARGDGESAGLARFPRAVGPGRQPPREDFAPPLPGRTHARRPYAPQTGTLDLLSTRPAFACILRRCARAPPGPIRSWGGQRGSGQHLARTFLRSKQDG